MPYTSGFSIRTGGWTGGANGLTVNAAGAAGVTAAVRLWSDDPTSAPRIISLRGGEILPVKVKYVFHNLNPGTTLTGLL